MEFEKLTDEQWGYIEPLLPKQAWTGRPRADDRRTINGVLFVLKTGIPWNDLPKEYGDDSTANKRLRDWERLGVWKRIMDALLSNGYSDGKLNIDKLSIDSDTIPAKKGESLSAMTPTRRLMGRRSMQSSTKIPLPSLSP